jgi:hypothetical protein
VGEALLRGCPLIFYFLVITPCAVHATVPINMRLERIHDLIPESLGENGILAEQQALQFPYAVLR